VAARTIENGSSGSNGLGGIDSCLDYSLSRFSLFALSRNIRHPEKDVLKKGREKKGH